VPDTWTFENDDAGFHEWLDDNEGAYFLNLRPLTDGQVLPMIHRADCKRFTRESDVAWTETVKVGGETQFILDRWCASELGVQDGALRCDCLS
jgi:hypothetical protein